MSKGLSEVLPQLKEIVGNEYKEDIPVEKQKGRGLFDHVNAIKKTQDPHYFDTLSDLDKKSWSNYMILRFLSMDSNFLPTLMEIQPYIQELEPELMYKALIGIYPRTQTYHPYIKSKSSTKFLPELVQLLSEHFQISKRQSEEYCGMMYETEIGKREILEIVQKYGWEKKQITKLKLKLPKK